MAIEDTMIQKPEDAIRYVAHSYGLEYARMEDALMWGCLVETWRVCGGSVEDFAGRLDVSPQKLQSLLRLTSSLALDRPYDFRPKLVEMGLLKARDFEEDKEPTFDDLAAMISDRPEKLLRRAYLLIEPALFADMDADPDCYFNEDGTPIEFKTMTYDDSIPGDALAMHRYLAMKKRFSMVSDATEVYAEYRRKPPRSWRYPFTFSVFHIFPGRLPLRFRVTWLEYVRWAFLDPRGCFREVRSWLRWYWEDVLSSKVRHYQIKVEVFFWFLRVGLLLRSFAFLAALRWLAGGRRNPRFHPWQGDVVALRDHRIEAHVHVRRRSFRKIFFEPRPPASDDDVADLRDLLGGDDKGAEEGPRILRVRSWRYFATRPRMPVHDLNRAQRQELERENLRRFRVPMITPIG